jgi:two-component system response regulator HydG
VSAGRSLLFVHLGGDARWILSQLRAGGWEVATADDVAAAARLLAKRRFAVHLLSLGADPWSEAHAELEQCIQSVRGTEWVLVCAREALDSAALQDLVLGQRLSFLAWPLEAQALASMLAQAEQRAALRGRHPVDPAVAEALGMVGAGAAITRLRAQILKVAVTTAPVLIGGESGSGKELAAQAIHRRSSRSAGPFVAVNCGAIAPSLLHAELFGHERGAFTGASSQRVGLIEAANHGTVFLDEIGDLPLDLQTSLLRFLQEKTIHRVGGVHSLAVNVRVVAASHVDLAAAVRAGRFREDLYYRLSVLPIDVPALRTRLEDLPMLAEHFLRACQTEGLRRIEGFRRRAMDAMLAHSWPGNVRELSNRVRRAVVMSDDYLVGPDDLGLTLYQPAEVMDLDAARTMAEREVISAALARVGRNVTHAARALGISRMTLYRLMDKHRIASCAE